MKEEKSGKQSGTGEKPYMNCWVHLFPLHLDEDFSIWGQGVWCLFLSKLWISPPIASQSVEQFDWTQSDEGTALCPKEIGEWSIQFATQLEIPTNCFLFRDNNEIQRRLPQKTTSPTVKKNKIFFGSFLCCLEVGSAFCHWFICLKELWSKPKGVTRPEWRSSLFLATSMGSVYIFMGQ